jgi:hypothetical protein
MQQQQASSRVGSRGGRRRGLAASSGTKQGTKLWTRATGGGPCVGGVGWMADSGLSGLSGCIGGWFWFFFWMRIVTGGRGLQHADRLTWPVGRTQVGTQFQLLPFHWRIGTASQR